MIIGLEEMFEDATGVQVEIQYLGGYRAILDDVDTESLQKIRLALADPERIAEDISEWYESNFDEPVEPINGLLLQLFERAVEDVEELCTGTM